MELRRLLPGLAAPPGTQPEGRDDGAAVEERIGGEVEVLVFKAEQMRGDVEVEKLHPGLEVAPDISLSYEAVVKGAADGILVSQTFVHGPVDNQRGDVLEDVERRVAAEDALVGEVVCEGQAVVVQDADIMPEMRAEAGIAVSGAEDVGRDGQVKL